LWALFFFHQILL